MWNVLQFGSPALREAKIQIHFIVKIIRRTQNCKNEISLYCEQLMKCRGI
jgi:hypothetical protein